MTRATSRPFFIHALLALTALLGAVSPAPAKDAPAATPAFSIPGGVFTNNLTLTLSSKSAGTIIRYTLDGTEPNTASSNYSASLAITNSLLVRARIFAAGLPPGPVASHTYVLLADDLLDFNSNLPLILLNTFGHEVSHDEKINATARVIRPQNGHATPLGPADFDGRGHINIRGRASLRYPKHSYTLKILAEDDDAAKVSILGMPPESDWILYAPYPDKTLMRDVLAYEMSLQLGRWAPHTQFVEVFVNDGGTKLSRRDYVGVYVFEEKVKRDLNRVALEKLDRSDHSEPAITGGYIFKKDHSDNVDMGPATQAGFPAYQGAITNNRVGFPTGPGGFPGDPAGFLPAYKNPYSRTVTNTSFSTRTATNTRGLELLSFLDPANPSLTTRPGRIPLAPSVTNHFGVPVRRDSSLNRTSFRTEDGEYHTEQERYHAGFKTSQTNQFYFVDPEPDEITGVQRGWLQHHVNRAEAALYGPDFKDAQAGYGSFLDPGSCIDYHLLVEVTKNADGFRFSTFFHKERGGKIKMGPVWDWNLSFGNCNGKQTWQPEYWLWPQLDDKEYSWFRRLFEDPDFAQKYVDRWSELRGTVFSSSNLLARVDQLAAQLQEPQARNFQRWPILGLAVNPNYYVGDSYEDEVKWMKEWTATRLAWIDKQFVAQPALKKTADGKVSLSTDAGTIYYTLDGRDPRTAGGAVAAGALVYESPLPSTAKLTARVLQSTNRWSGPVTLGK